MAEFIKNDPIQIIEALLNNRDNHQNIQFKVIDGDQDGLSSFERKYIPIYSWINGQMVIDLLRK